MRALPIALALLVSSTAIGGPPRRGVLVEAPLTPGLARVVDRALANARLADVLGPAELAARLAEKESVQRATKEAEELLGKAARAALFMRRVEAVSTARSAVASLTAVGAAHHAPKLWARANIELGLALLLKPADEQGAREALVAALSVQPRTEIEADRRTPAVRALLQQALGKAASVLPGPDALGKVADLAGLERLLWLGARADGSVELIDYDAKARRILSHRRERSSPGTLSRVASELVTSALAPPASAPTSLVATRPAVAPKVTPRPWYKRWWVWTIAAAVVAGSAVAIVVATRDTDSGPTTGYDVEWTF